ncbi:MAG TPA: nitrous oxide reductase family maturation protein NosD [Rubricoccaceae bacterium]|nr:nitrous oxide reductase family maturation protein NosD [Rubricoccaceae bacterium]
MRTVVLLLALMAPAASAGAPPPRTLVVAPGGATLAGALAAARPGDRLVVRPGVYREPTLVVDKPVEVVGEPGAVLDGEGQRELIQVVADGVTVRGLTFRNTGHTFVGDRAALRVEEAGGCRIEGNRFEGTFFGVYLAQAHDCAVAANVFVGPDVPESLAGNGIHLWYCRRVTVTDNRIARHRDGIYFEFVEDSAAERNVSTANRRYGLHFMFSDRCRYVGNVFRANGAGVAVMYTEEVAMTGNRFEDNRGPAAYGLLLKQISGGTISGNRFAGNTVGLFAEGAARMAVEGNDFVRNGWAVRVMADARQTRFARNNFVANTFDVGTNGRHGTTVFEGNYWSAYRGYDLDRDGTGDVAFRPVRLFALIVEEHEPALLLLRSLFVDLLDLAERVAPALTPETLADACPAMRPLPR